MNEKLRVLFESGQIKKAILGDSDFFWKDDVWGNHKSSAVISYLIDWYSLGEKNDLIKKIKIFFIDEIQNDKRINEIDNGLISLSLIRFYCTEANKLNKWILEREFILQLLFDCISRYSNEELISLNILRDIEYTRKFFPEAEEVVIEINVRLKKKN